MGGSPQTGGSPAAGGAAGSTAGHGGDGGGPSDPCLLEPCANGTCTDLGNGDYSCNCDSGWTGTNCETAIVGEPYDNPDVVPALTLTIDRNTRYQTYTGLGSGIIFYQSHLLNGIPEGEREAFYDAVFEDVDHQYLMFWFRPTEETNDNDDPMVLNRDAFSFDPGYAAVIEEAQARDEDLTLVATVMTPPAWLKTNGSILGGGTLDTTVPNAYEEFAEFVFAGLLSYTEMGLSIDAVTLTNEPDFSLTHEDAVYTPAEAAAVYHYTVDHLQALVDSAQNTAGVQMPLIMAPSTLSVTAVNGYVEAFKNDGDAWDHIDWVSTHQYGGGNNYENFLAANENLEGKLFIMSEWHSANEEDIDDETEEVMEQSNAMITAFAGMVSSYWWFEIGHPGNPYAGVCQTPWGSSYICDKSYQHWRQWSALTPIDSTRVAVSDPPPTNNADSLSYVAFDDGSTITIHLLNRSNDAAYVSFQIASGSILLVERWDTGAAAGFEQQPSLQPTSPAEPVILEMPARTARTLKLTY